MDNSQEQDDELLALEAIYPERFHQLDNQLKGGQVDVAVEQPGPVTVILELPGPDGNIERRKHVAEHLPYVRVVFVYPESYPSSQPPALMVKCPWMTEDQVVRLGQHMTRLFEEGSVLMFGSLDWLQAEAWAYLEMTQILDLRHFGHAAPRVFDEIIAHDEKERQRVFNESYFECLVCFGSYMGADCFRFHICGHVFCRACICEYFNVQITDGNIQRLECPVPKCKKQALPNEVKSLVSADMYERYDRLMLQTTLDSMGDIVYCPRKACGSAVVREPDEISRETGQKERSQLGRCTACGFSFCILCKKAWHGLEYCTPSDLEQLISKYENADDAGKEVLRLQYGPHVLVAARELQTRAWIKEHTKQCPQCNYGIEKNDGCNKMACRKCGAYFCWLCLSVLSHSDPYSHYSSGKCANKLFQGVDVNDMGWVDNFED